MQKNENILWLQQRRVIPHDPSGIALFCLTVVAAICLARRKHRHEQPDNITHTSLLQAEIEPQKSGHRELKERKSDETIFQERLNQLVKNKITRGYTIQNICRDMPVSRSTLHKWRTGEVFPNRKSVERVAAYFGVSVQWLYSEKADEIYHDLLDDIDHKA